MHQKEEEEAVAKDEESKELLEVACSQPSTAVTSSLLRTVPLTPQTASPHTHCPAPARAEDSKLHETGATV